MQNINESEIDNDIFTSGARPGNCDRERELYYSRKPQIIENFRKNTCGPSAEAREGAKHSTVGVSFACGTRSRNARQHINKRSAPGKFS